MKPLLLLTMLVLASCTTQEKRTPTQVTGEVGLTNNIETSLNIVAKSMTVQLLPGVDLNYRVTLAQKPVCALKLIFKSSLKSVSASSDENINGIDRNEVQQACEAFAQKSKWSTAIKAHLRGPAIGDAEAFFRGELSEVEAKVTLINTLFLK